VGAGVAGLALGAELAGGYGYGGGGYYSAPYAGDYYSAPYADAGYPPPAYYSAPSENGPYNDQIGAYGSQAYGGEAYPAQPYPAQPDTTGASPCADRCGGYYAPPAYPAYAPPQQVYAYRPPCGC